ncbi:MAG: adenosine-specific kinase [Candidatus Aenigmatarchaeota archaeon]
MKMEVVKVKIPEGCNVILGQSHFIKTVEDLYEAIVNTVPQAKFGIGFCEASGKALIRCIGNDKELEKLAAETAFQIGCGHSFIIFLKDAYPINVLNRIKDVYEVVSLYAATANPLEVIVAETEQGRGILGVIDGMKPKGIEKEEDVKERKDFLRKIGYKI